MHQVFHKCYIDLVLKLEELIYFSKISERIVHIMKFGADHEHGHKNQQRTGLVPMCSNSIHMRALQRQLRKLVVLAQDSQKQYCARITGKFR